MTKFLSLLPVKLRDQIRSDRPIYNYQISWVCLGKSKNKKIHMPRPAIIPGKSHHPKRPRPTRQDLTPLGHLRRLIPVLRPDNNPTTTFIDFTMPSVD
jgi:hypothetical protein